MSDKIKDIFVVVIFFLFVFGFFIINLVKAPDEISVSERRKLQQFPEFTYNTVMAKTEADGNFMRFFEKYTLDQFVWRDAFRELKAKVSFNIFMKKDNNNIYIVDGQVSKYWSTMNEALIKDAANKFNKIYNSKLKNKGMNVYYSLIPDKNYFIAEQNGYPSIDYDKFVSIMKENMNVDIKYIDIFNDLTVDDYYATDIHWRQEKISKIVEKLASSMGINVEAEYEEKTLEPFYGVYYGQSALPIEGEKLVYLTNEVLENCKVTGLDGTTAEFYDTKIYNEEDFKNVDPYDIFLEGAKPFFVIENEAATSDKELIIYRDSFGSSLIPLMVQGYKKITVIDLRYIANIMIDQYNLVEYKEGTDVLFLYSTEVLNNSSILKVF